MNKNKREYQQWTPTRIDSPLHAVPTNKLMVAGKTPERRFKNTLADWAYKLLHRVQYFLLVRMQQLVTSRRSVTPLLCN